MQRHSGHDVPVITIDGPGGAGKGTASQSVAAQLGWHLLDSGKLYRLIGLAALRANLEYDNAAALADLAMSMDVAFEAEPGRDGLRVKLDGTDVSSEVSSEEAGMMASKVGAIPLVRKALLSRQQAFARPPGLVADGRDMGTVVFKEAPLKIYLTASVEARANRRYEQLRRQGLDGNLARLSEAIQARDEADMSRAVAPLVPASDAVVVDSTEMTIAAVSDHIIALAAQRSLLTR